MTTKLRHMPFAAAVLVMAAAAAAQSGDSRPKLVPNSQHYRMSGAEAATGRSGSAVLAARILMNKDHSVDVETTTGALDSSATPPGNIAKLQYKALDKNGRAILTTNWNGLNAGGYFHQTLAGLSRNQQAQLQANITGIDGNRTDVVTVIASAKRRPDLAVSGIHPATGLMNVPLVISAAVSEVNGDTSATANC